MSLNMSTTFSEKLSDKSSSNRSSRVEKMILDRKAPFARNPGVSLVALFGLEDPLGGRPKTRCYRDESVPLAYPTAQAL